MIYCENCMCPVQENQAICPTCGKSVKAETAPHRLLPGTLLNKKYLIGAALGEGGFGITYIGRDTMLDMRVAVKEYFPNGYVNRSTENSSQVLCSTSEDRQAFFKKNKDRFLEEARMLAKFSGEPGIVDVRDFFEENQTAYIVMAFIDGETLKHYLDRSGRIPFGELITILTPVMRSLELVHQSGLIHRDISPQNIMLGKTGAKLLDFGAARNVSAAESSGFSVVLKHGYAPEEQYRSKGDQGPWTDVYALSATIYHCLTGTIPDDAGQRVFRDEVRLPSALGVNITPQQEAALMRGLGITKADRWQSVGELYRALTGQIPVPALPVNPAAAGNSGAPAPAAADNDKTRYISPEEQQRTLNTLRSGGSVPLPPQYSAQSPAPAAPVYPSAPPVSSAVPDYVPQNPANAAGSLSAEADTGKGKKKRKKGRLSKEAIIAAAAVAALVIGGGIYFMRNQSMTLTTESGYSNEIKIDDKTALIYRQNVNLSLIKYLKKMPNLYILNFSRCTFEDNALKELQKMENITDLTFSEGDLSEKVMEHIPASVEKLVINGKEMTNDRLKAVPFDKLTALKSLWLYNSPELTDITTAAVVKGTLEKLYLNKTGVSNLDFLDGFDSLKCLETDGCKIKSLPELPELNELHLNGSELTSLDFLKNTPKLRNLRVSDNKITDLSPLNGLDLTYLYADNNRISDISPLKTSKSLQTLSLNNNQVSDISVLSECAALMEVQLENNQVRDLEPLTGSTKLFTVKISHNRISSLKPLSNNAKLISLSATNNQLTNLDGLEDCIDLKYLRVSNNQITDISGIINATQLADVRIDNNQIEDISLLAKSKENLTVFSANKNRISDISALQGTVKLTYLSLDDNKLSSIEPLSESQILRVFSAENNEITAIDGLKDLQKLECIYLPHNKITDASTLENIGKASGTNPTVINLSSNQISTLSLSDRRKYILLALYNNPLKNPEVIGNTQANYVEVPYLEHMDYTLMKDKFNNYYVTDCPKDHQVAVRNDFGDSYNFRTHFLSTEEMDQENLSTKNKIFNKSDDENGNDTSEEESSSEDGSSNADENADEADTADDADAADEAKPDGV